MWLSINKRYIKHFENMIKDIGIFGRTFRCPAWDCSLDPSIKFDKCIVCKEFFKKLKTTNRTQYNNNCPCDHYTPGYLIRFLNEVIENSK